MEDDSINFYEAMDSSNSQKWIDAMNEKIKSIKDNDVRDLVPLLEGAKPISCKLIFKTKRDSKGNMERYQARLATKDFMQKESINYKWKFKTKRDSKDNVKRYKARLVAKGFTQKEIIDYKDSFRIIMALVAHLDLKLHPMNVKTVFLNGDINETIYMVQLENFVSRDPKNLVCKFNKSIYGLK